MSIIPDLPNAKMKRILTAQSFDVPVGTSVNRLLDLPPKKFLLLSQLQFVNSQLLQIIDAGGLIIDDEPLNGIASLTSTARLFFNAANMQIVSALPSSVTQLIPVRRSIVLNMTSTAAGAGTIAVDMWGYILDDEKGIFKQYSSLTK